MLPHGVHWPTLHSPVLFVRHFYQPLFDDVLNGLNHFKSADTAGGCVGKVIVCGNPGIGKSAFGMYALFRAVRAGRTVVYASAKLSPSVLVFRSGTVQSASHVDDVAHLTADPESVLISDSLVPPVCKAFTMLITSPRKDRWHEFNKEMDCTSACCPRPLLAVSPPLLTSSRRARSLLSAVLPRLHPGRDARVPRCLLPQRGRGWHDVSLRPLGRHPAPRAGQAWGC